jgi:hypothetical protein
MTTQYLVPSMALEDLWSLPCGAVADDEGVAPHVHDFEKPLETAISGQIEYLRYVKHGGARTWMRFMLDASVAHEMITRRVKDFRGEGVRDIR